MGKTLAPSEEIEYARLFGDYCLAVNDSYQKLVSYGIDSREFREANAKATTLCAKMRKIEEPATPLRNVDARSTDDLTVLRN